LCVFQHKGLKKPETPQRCEGFGGVETFWGFKGVRTPLWKILFSTKSCWQKTKNMVKI